MNLTPSSSLMNSKSRSKLSSIIVDPKTYPRLNGRGFPCFKGFVFYEWLIKTLRID